MHTQRATGDPRWSRKYHTLSNSNNNRSKRDSNSRNAIWKLNVAIWLGAETYCFCYERILYLFNAECPWVIVSMCEKLLQNNFEYKQDTFLPLLPLGIYTTGIYYFNGDSLTRRLKKLPRWIASSTQHPYLHRKALINFLLVLHFPGDNCC